MVLTRSRNFRLLWTGQVISVIGDGMQRIALLWWAAQRHGTGTLAALAVASVLPLVVLSPLGGILADRHPRRRLMVSADVLRLFTTGLLAAVIAAVNPSVPLILVLVVLTGVGTAAFDPAYGASVPQVVDADDLAAANGLNMANSALAGIVGPLLGGVLLAAFSPMAVLAINAATFAWSAANVALVADPLRPPPAAVSAERGEDRPLDVLRGLGLGRLVGMASVLNLVVAPVPLLMVALAVRRFDTSAIGFGAMQVALSCGLLGGALLAGALARISLRVAMTAVGVLLGVAGSLPYVPTVAVLVGIGVAVALANTLLMLRFQLTVPADRHGRVFGVVGSLSEGLRPAGMAMAGPLLATAGLTWSFLVIGAAVVVATALFAPTPTLAPDVASTATLATSVAE
jgi:MFS family permease